MDCANVPASSRTLSRTRASQTPSVVAVDGPGRHDHDACVTTLLGRARQSFVDKGLKLTALRLRVLEEIAASHDAMGAYDVIERLACKSGARLAPISVYRAIDALQSAGLVHRLESRNAFFACHLPHTGAQDHIALVCEGCSSVVEVPAGRVYGLIETAAASSGFKLRAMVAEGVGMCRKCQTSMCATAGEARA